MITATFSLVQQLVNMRCLPPYGRSIMWDPVWLMCRFRLHMVHTSDKVQGQVFIPVANWIREHSLLTTQLTLNFVFSYHSDHYSCRRLQRPHSAHQCLRLCCGNSHVHHIGAHLASDSICQTTSLHSRDCILRFLRIPGW